MVSQGCAGIYKGLYEYTLVYKGLQGFKWVYRGIQEFTWLYKGIQGLTSKAMLAGAMCTW